MQEGDRVRRVSAPGTTGVVTGVDGDRVKVCWGYQDGQFSTTTESLAELMPAAGFIPHLPER